MSRYTQKVFKKSRRLGFSVLESGKEFNKNKKRTSIVPGHTIKRRRVKSNTNYSRQLNAKQKVRFMYGLTDKQLKRMFIKASKDKTNTAYALLTILESRLDNLVYRMGFTTTRAAARQLVKHGHVIVNDKKVDIPSIIIDVKSKISLKPVITKNVFIKESLENYPSAYQFLKIDKKNFVGEYLRLPQDQELKIDFDLPLVIEYYNRLV